MNYTTNSGDSTVTLSSLVSSAFNTNSDVIIPDSVLYEGKYYKVTKLANYSIPGVYNSVTIPATLENITKSPFEPNSTYGRTKPIETIYFNAQPKGEGTSARPMFGHLCRNLVFGNGIISIPSYFMSTDTLKSVVFSNTIKSIGDMAFYNCKKLSSIALGESVETIGKSAFFVSPKIRN